MKIIGELTQGTPDWLEFRQNHITATNAATIMGMNPFQTKLELWQEKTLGWEKPFTQKELNRMAEGTRLEPIARERFIFQTGLFVEPMVAEHDEYQFISASFDGMSPDLSTCVEIKCGKKAFMLAQIDEIPPYYHCQMLHQMLVNGLHEMFYYCYDYDSVTGICIRVERNDEFIANLLAEEIKFWNNIQALTIP